MTSLILSAMLIANPPAWHLSCKDWGARVYWIMRDDRLSRVDKQRLIIYLRTKVVESCPIPGQLATILRSPLPAR